MEFDVVNVTSRIITFIRDYYAKNHLKGVVIGISGGKDSAVVAALFVKALGSENVIGLWLPCESKTDDKLDALALCKSLKIELIECDLANTYKVLTTEINHHSRSEDIISDANINLKPRLRMATLYYYAAMFSKIKKGGYLVAGTSNKCERFAGYFTKGGDNIADIYVLSNLTVSEVIEIGDYLKIPASICHKVPHDGLSELSDEEKMGVTYHDIEEYLNGREANLLPEIKEKIEYLHQRNLHKFHIPEFKK